MKSVTVELKPRDLEKAKNFAEARLEKSIDQYSRRGQTNIDKIKYDITIGALGEIGIYRMLKRLGIKVSPPDFNIYEAKNKSYDADLHDKDGYRFHCKSQSRDSADTYGNSYILQYGGNGNGHIDKLFKSRTNRDFLIPCLVDIDTKEVIDAASTKWNFHKYLIAQDGSVVDSFSTVTGPGNNRIVKKIE